MQAYFVEGVYAPRKALKKLKSGKLTAADLEPFARTIWAGSPEEALRLAGDELQGGDWVAGPRLSRKSEEQRMRQQGMAELPGLKIKPQK